MLHVKPVRRFTESLQARNAMKQSHSISATPFILEPAVRVLTVKTIQFPFNKDVKR